ncbi:MAG: hypothetical protein LBD15_02145 [Holosporales bacterium]|jgi:hypothetical protein|nr:hypothetical protein [Holosporales bacterium]
MVVDLNNLLPREKYDILHRQAECSADRELKAEVARGVLADPTADPDLQWEAAETMFYRLWLRDPDRQEEAAILSIDASSEQPL